METLKLCIAAMLSPFNLSLVLQFIGWSAVWRKKTNTGLVLFGLATAILTVGGLSGFTYDANRRLEYAFEPLDLTTIEIGPDEKTVIVVLGTGFNDDPTMPANSQVSGVFLSRLLEGFRIFRDTPHSQLLISVAGDASEESKATFLSRMAELLAIDSTRVSMISSAESTADEAMETRRRFAEHRVILATSASHMLRATAIFQDAGFKPIPAPTGYSFPRHGSPGDSAWERWIPSTGGITANHQWLYENVALLWHNVLGG